LQRAWLGFIALSICSCSGSGNPEGAGGAGGTGGTAARDGGIHFTGGAGGRGDAAVETPGAVDAQARAVLTIGTKYVVSLGDVMLNQNAVADVTVTNIGNANADSIVVRPSNGVSASGCAGMTLTPEASCTLTITGNPTDPLSWYGTVMIYASRLDTAPLQVTVTARAFLPSTLTFSPSFINLHDLLLGAPIPPHVITVSAAEAITDLTITTRGPDLALDPAGTTCGAALAAGASCVIVANVTATTTGDLRDAVVVSHGGPTGPVFAVHVQGFVRVPPTLALTPSEEQTLIAAPGQASPAVTLGVANLGELPTGPLAVAVTGSGAAEFETTSDCRSLPAFGTCTVTLVFNPPVANAISRTVGVSVADTAAGGSQVAVGLTGLVVEASVLAISPDTSDLGPATVGAIGTATTFTVLNTGAVPLARLAVSSSSDEFALASDTCTGAPLAAGAACSLSVALAPISAGPRSATLEVAAAGGGEPAFRMLTGKGIPREVPFATPSAIDFADVNLNMTSPPAAVLVKNGGASSTGKLAFTMSGDVASFQVADNTCLRALAPAEECTFDVTFAPKANYGLAAVLTITDGRLSTNVKLTGWGYELH
jgi:hypothetical protein